MTVAALPHPGRLQLRVAALASALVAIVAAALLATAPVRAGTTHLVEIEDFAFAPATLTITAGDTVTWTNLDAIAHTATSTSGAFDSGLLDQGESWSMTFTTPGTYDYLCTPHPSMTGRIVVQAAPAAPSAAPPSGGGNLPDVAMAAPAGPDLRIGLGIGLLALAGVIVAVRRRRAATD